MRRLLLVFFALSMLCGCNNKNECTTFEIDNKDYKWSIDYEDKGKLVVYDAKNDEVKYDIPLSAYKVVYDDNVSSTKAILYCYNDSEYLLVVGI